MTHPGIRLPQSPENPPANYMREPSHTGMIVMRDVAVPMRDGVELSVDIYRPETEEPLPALLAFAIYNKDLSSPDCAGQLSGQPAWSTSWAGPQEAGDTSLFVSRGYIHVVGSPRNIGKSGSGGSREWDSYDLIEWIAAQPWCDGKVGMVGVSGYGAEQMYVAQQKPPHLKAIFGFDPRGAYGTLGGFREEYPGGVVHLFRYLTGHFSVMHQDKHAPGELDPQREQWWREAMDNPDYAQYVHLFNILTMRGQHMPAFFDIMLNPFVDPEDADRSEARIGEIDIPVFTGSGWYGYTYKTHLNGAQSYWKHLQTNEKKLLFVGPAHLERPLKGMHGEMLKFHDKHLKGIDSGIDQEPPVRYWLMGANEWRSAQDWPLPETQWTPFFLNSWGRLRTDPFVPGSIDDRIPADSFVQMPVTQTRDIATLRYLSEPLPHDLEVTGPASLKLFASIDQADTNWIVTLKDVGPDVSVQTVREGETSVPSDLPERELTRGWLKASNRALDEERSTEYKPFHKLTREAAEPVTPGEIVEYDIEILSTANLFRKGHRVCLEISAADLPTGVAGATNAEYIPYHVVSSKTTLHNIFHSSVHPSRLLLPVIPARDAGE
ncbi:MAG: CocE/NonD family hydrolase [Candidatus Leucobacter sulfamidivorax]|nr:CocE/NonD family hydrolase [Candidatus Leucobacter sulfamidivorax]